MVLYSYATRRRLAELADRGAKLIRLPVSVDLLWRTVDAWLAIRAAAPALPTDVPAPPPEQADATPPPRFSAAQLARLREISTSVDCECPNHLSGIVASLEAFERYSRECQNESPSDARLHALLARGTGRARVLMEQLLARVLEHDGIQL